MEIRTPTGVITPTQTEKLLGAVVHQDLKWTDHILHDGESLVKVLSTRLGALKKVCKVANFKNRKMIAEGLIMSKLSYLIPLWSGSETYLHMSPPYNKVVVEGLSVHLTDLYRLSHNNNCGSTC